MSNSLGALGRQMLDTGCHRHGEKLKGCGMLLSALAYAGSAGRGWLQVEVVKWSWQPTVTVATSSGFDSLMNGLKRRLDEIVEATGVVHVQSRPVRA